MRTNGPHRTQPPTYPIYLAARRTGVSTNQSTTQAKAAPTAHPAAIGPKTGQPAQDRYDSGFGAQPRVQNRTAQTQAAQAPTAQASHHPKSGVPAQAPAARWTEVSTNQSTTQFGAPAAIGPKTGQPAQAQDRAQRKVVAPLRAPVRPQVQLQIPVTSLPQNLNQRGASIETFQELNNYSFFRKINSIKDINEFVTCAKNAIEAKILSKEDKHDLNIRLVNRYLLKYKPNNQKIEDPKKIAEQFSADARELYRDDDSGYVDLFKEAMTMRLINGKNISFSRDDIKSIKDIDAFLDLAKYALNAKVLSEEDKHYLNIGLVDKYLLKYKHKNQKIEDQKIVAERFIDDARKLYPDDYYGCIDLLSLFNKAILKEVTAKPPVLEQVPNTGPLQIPVTGPLQNLTQAQPPVPTTHLSLSHYYNRPAPDTASSTVSLSSRYSSQSLDSSRSSLVSVIDAARSPDTASSTVSLNSSRGNQLSDHPLKLGESAKRFIPQLIAYEEKLSNPSQILPPQTTIEPTNYVCGLFEWLVSDFGR